MKKGQVSVAVYFRIFEILLLVTVIAIIASEISNVKDSGLYQKKFLSRDIALVMDSLTNARGNLLYVYNPPLADLQKFKVGFVNGAVSVDDQSWSYAVNNNIKMSFPVNTQFDALALKKTGNSIVIEKLSPSASNINGFLLECEPAQLSSSQIILDPGHSNGDEGFTGGIQDSKGSAVTESAMMLLTAVAIAAPLKANPDTQVIGTRALEANYVNGVLSQEAKTIDERIAVINANKDAFVISLHAGKQPKNQNIVKAFVNKDSTPEARRLACSLLNSIAEKYKMTITGTAVIPVDLSQVGSDNPKQVLVNNRTAVLLELGNMDYPNNALLENPVDVSQAILSGIALARTK